MPCPNHDSNPLKIMPPRRNGLHTETETNTLHPSWPSQSRQSQQASSARTDAGNSFQGRNTPRPSRDTSLQRKRYGDTQTDQGHELELELEDYYAALNNPCSIEATEQGGGITLIVPTPDASNESRF